MYYHIHFLDAGKRCYRNTNEDFNWISARKKRRLVSKKKAGKQIPFANKPSGVG